ncbi:1-acyl-sn-glycerol-3-phosphate acyltransferase [Fructobacillus sp. M1-13]|uniref:1-acyl-sn-glycerol-3-phosphate acyltransferase n=1 Tax=Fructobacillus papyriferae TaxID=2713171 RepID=A0ABS5QQI6_9LACO|nr:1-acyl-sn-glycerol-3-phosphate acyltransferase [Fructobacillus papyriferae]MBS9334760.1 1-acyl-sn-glycerol-3-phosphate acyltransferase [Fructobacillus papyriferae]MCD2158750.1 1-acyl-sn-glycerol-3-phosphate acyltransferase [Fructobacillus papyriferae]
MFYRFIRVFVVTLVSIINGRTHYLNKNRLPKDDNYILVAPHRTWWDPVWYAMAAYPKRFIFMAKKELFQNYFLRQLIVSLGAFPVDRKNVGSDVIRKPVSELKSGDRSLIMFPSGSRHSQKLKSGSILIAKLSKKPIVPAVYQGPVKFSHLFLRKRVTMNFGEPIYIDPKVKLTDEVIAEYNDKIQASFEALDQEIDPNWVYVDPKKAK